MKWILLLVVCFTSGCVYSRRESFKFEAEVHSLDGFAVEPKYEVVGRATWEIWR